MPMKSNSELGDGDPSRISRFVVHFGSENKTPSLKNLLHSLSSAYLASIKHRGNSTNVNIFLDEDWRVSVIWDRNLSGSYTSGSSHQVYFPEDVWFRGAKARQLFLLGNIFLKICEPTIGRIEVLELYKELENGKELEDGALCENVQLVAHWYFICSCLSFEFSKRAFVQVPRGESGSALKNVALCGTAMAATCWSAPFILEAMGFGASGIIKGLFAAKWQGSFVGGAATKYSGFSLLQSTAASGCVGLKVAGGMSGAVAAVTGGASQFVSSLDSTSYQYLYNSDWNDWDKLEDLIACKNVVLGHQK